MVISKRFFLFSLYLFILTETSAQINIEYCDTAYYHSYRDDAGQHCLFKRTIPGNGFYKAFKNKNAVEEFYVKNNQINGPYKYFKPGGQVVIEGYYINGFKTGLWKAFNLNNPSLLLSTLIYQDGKLQGKAIYFDVEEGQLKFKGSYKNNKKEGKWKVYEKGKLAGKLKFKNGTVLPSYKETDLWKANKWRLESTQ